jgi:hypothetical protein
MSLPTFDEVFDAVNRVHPVSTRQLHRDFKALGIAPVGRRQRPNRYAENTAARILAARGHTETMIHGKPARKSETRKPETRKGRR